MKENEVVAIKKKLDYPDEGPFHPNTFYPEYEFNDLGHEENQVYEALRDCLHCAALDIDYYGTKRWNPLSELLRAGETVLIKPNLVKEYHPVDPDGWKYTITHGSLIRAISDYIWKAIGASGTIIVADAPQTDSSFKKMVQILGLDRIQIFYQNKGLQYEVVDLRKEEWTSKDDVIIGRKKLEGDPLGYVSFDLAENSEFAEHHGEGKYYGADYDSAEVNKHHSGGRHEYLVAGTAIAADVVFSLPKLKTHKKAGITVSLKNLVGVNGDKNWLPHHTEGDIKSGGDERPALDNKSKVERSLVSIFRMLSLKIPYLGTLLHRKARQAGTKVFGDTEDIIRSGNWYGNDTVWRMCLDLNKLILYGNMDGTLKTDEKDNRKRHYALVDGIIAGEGKGPMNPDPVLAGMLIFGLNPASVDAACAYLMGYGPDNIPIVRQAFLCKSYPIANWSWQDIEVKSNVPDWNMELRKISYDKVYHFKPHYGWLGHIERNCS